MGLFDNATSVVINNKEVQSIKMTSNNAVLYEKQTTPTPSKIATHFYKSGNYLYLRDPNNNGIASARVKRYRNGNLNSTLTTNGSGRISYSNKYTYTYEGDSTYEGCTYP